MWKRGRKPKELRKDETMYLFNLMKITEESALEP